MINLECKRCGYWYSLETMEIPKHCPGCKVKINGTGNFKNSNLDSLVALEYWFKIKKNPKAI